MADVYVNALTTISTEPTTTDSLVAVNRNTNEGKIIDYNLLADVILNKITSKQFSGLNTTSKLLVGAINELDSDVSALNSSTTITPTINEDIIGSNFSSIRKVGSLVIIGCNFQLYAGNHTSNTVFFSGLPNASTPVRAVLYTGGTVFTAIISTTGQLQVNGGFTTSNTAYVFGEIVYFASE